jgi:hypothetical protein
LLFTYDDPKPLDAGQIALWTYNNGMMLSRVSVFYENEIKPTYKSRALVASDIANQKSPTKLAQAK